MAKGTAKIPISEINGPITGHLIQKPDSVDAGPTLKPKKRKAPPEPEADVDVDAPRQTRSKLKKTG